MKNLKPEIEAKLKKAGADYFFTPLPSSLPLDVASHADYLKISLRQALATLLYRTEKGLVAVQRGADRKIDETKLRKLLGVKKLEMAKKEDLDKLGVESGLVPLTGMDLPYFMDQNMAGLDYVYGGSGSREFNLRVNPHDLQKVNGATVADFTLAEAGESGRRRRVFSGSRPTGRLHVGNYLGAIKGYIELQNRDDLDCVYCVVDLHGITTPYDPKTYAAGVREVVLDYLGAGLDPKKCHTIIQSDLKAEHLELAYYLGTIFPVARLEDLPTYKEKKAQHPEYVNMGLLYYPILMAADIMIYKAELVPTGVDQEPHIELTREVARKFNGMFGETFPEPKRFDTPGRYVPSLLGEGKMSKSVEGSYISLTDDLATIKAKLAKAVTDEGKGEKFPEEGPAANLVTFVELFQGHDRAQQYREAYKKEGIRYGELKAELAEAIFKELEPIQKRRKYYEEHPEEVDKILEEGKNYAKKIADETLAEVREKMGLV